PTYIGRIDHGGRSHKGNHQAIIDELVWDRVQATLAANVNGSRGPAPAESSLLAGKLVDNRGVPMVAVHACKGKVRYRYYVSRDLHFAGDASKTEGWRLPSREIEPLVRARVAALLNDPMELLASSGAGMPSPDELKSLIGHGKAAATKLAGPRAPSAKLLRDLVAEVRLGTDRITMLLNAAKLANLLEIPHLSEAPKLDVPAALKRSGCVMRLITHSGSAAVPEVDRTLVKAVAQGRAWWQELQSNTNLTLEDIGRREGITGSYVGRIVRLAFLSPQMLGNVIDGTLPAHLTVKRLTAPDAISARWDQQHS
ncbi:MAG: hypothetical protein H0W71_07440, partial [Sphingomonas sp.]|nr:hypothetical protein [Sphingomonas sp.]